MKKLFLIVAFLFFASPAKAEFKVEFQISKMHGLLNFVETISGDNNRSKTLKEVFDKSKYNNPSFGKLIADFNAARKPLLHGWTYDGYPQNRYMGQNLGSLLLVSSIFSKSTRDLHIRSMGYMPVEDQKRFFDILVKFEPVYDELVWNPSKDKLRNYLDSLEEDAKRWKLDELFKRAMIFYRANWPESLPFYISLYPIPGSEGHTTAESMGSVISVGVIVDEDDDPGRFGVIFHEICHSLYESQSREFQGEMEEYFLSSRSKYASHAYRLVNEALATAIGNGWAYERAAGRIDDGEWYDDEYVNGFAKGIYGEVKKYLSSARRIDRSFVSYAVNNYETVFPDSIYEYDVIMNKIFLLSDGTIPGEEINPIFKSNFNVSSIFRNSPVDHETSLENLAKSSDTLLVLISEKGKEQLKRLASVFEPLQKSIPDLLLRQTDYVFSSVDPGGRAFIVVKAETAEALTKALGALKNSRTVDRNKPFLDIPL